MNIIEALQDKNIFLPVLPGGLDSWRSWIVFFKSLYGLPLDAGELELFKKCTGRSKAPVKKSTEAWVISGRRSGKSFAAALLAIFSALFEDFWKKRHIQGELVLAPVLAASQQQARIVFSYVKAILSHSSFLRGQVARWFSDYVELNNGVRLEIKPASWRTIRGYKIPIGIFDEPGYWFDELGGKNPASEIANAVRPGIETGGFLIGISSAGVREGLLFDQYEKHYARDDDAVLIWRSDTLTMFPGYDQARIDAAMAEDPVAARTEYFSEFREEQAALIDSIRYDQAVKKGRVSLPPALCRGREYASFADPAAGGGDSFACCIAHSEEKRLEDSSISTKVIVIDKLLEARGNFSPAATVFEFSRALHAYGIYQIWMDHFAGSWAAECFAQCGVKVRYSDLTASELYLDFLVKLNNGVVELLDDKRLRSQFLSLTRRPSTTGRDKITAPRSAGGGHGDLANCVSGAAWLTFRCRQMVSVFQ